MNATSNTKQLQKETLEYGQHRIEESPFQKFLKDKNLPDTLTEKDLQHQYDSCMQSR